MARKIKLHFDTRAWMRTYPNAPKGRGSWAFSIEARSQEIFWTPGNTTYTEAKAWMTKLVQTLDIPPHVTEVDVTVLT